MNLGRLFQLLVISHLKQEKLRVLFTLVSIVLGVSVYVAIRLTTENILIGFNAATHYISDKDSVLITSNKPISETIIPKLLNIPAVDSIIPVSTRYVQAYIGSKNIGFIPVIGIDILAMNQIVSTNNSYHNLNVAYDAQLIQDEPVYALVSRGLVEDTGYLQLHVSINGESKPIQPIAVVENNTPWGDYIIVVDIKNFQDLFKEYASINQLHLTFSTPNIEKAIKAVAATLPSSLKLSQGNENAHYAEQITSIFKFNLNFLICLALLVTAIIIYNAISYYVLERRRDFGIMLMLGAQPGVLFLCTLLTALLLGIFCSLGGLGIGYLITWINIKYIVQTFSTLFLPVRMTQVICPESLVIEVILLVVTIAFLVSILPCLEIYRIPLRQTTFYQTYEEQFQTKIPKLTVLGVVLFALSSLSLMPAVLRWKPVLVYYALSGLLLSVAFFLPGMLRIFLVFLRRLLKTISIEALMAIDHIKSTMRKNVVAIAALSITISLYLTTIIVIDSTRYTSTSWTNQIFSADVYLNTYTFKGNYISKEVADFIVNNPDVQAVNFLVHKDTIYHHQPLRIKGAVFSTLGSYYKIPFLQPMNEAQLRSTFADPQNIVVSEHFAQEFHYHIGDYITIPGNHGSYQLKIANIFYNYSSYQNTILIPHTLFQQLYDDPRFESALIYLKPPANYQGFLSVLKEQFPNANLIIQNQIEVKNTGKQMIEQTFKISKAIISIIFTITVLTLFNILEQLILSRRHEFTVFWALGARDNSLIKMCLWDSFLIYAVALLVSIIPTFIGILLIFNYLIELLFGIDIILMISYRSIASFLILLFIIAFLDGLIPVLKIRKFIHAEGLRYE